MKSTFLTILSIATFFNSFAQNKLPLFEKEKAGAKGGWLIDSVNAKAQLISGENNQLVLSNGQVSRTFVTQPNCATVSNSLAGSGIILNARMVGCPEVVKNTTLELWRPGMKLIAVTFSSTPEEQRENYDIIHSICK